MKQKLFFIFGILWASPITLFAFIFALILQAKGYAKFHHWDGISFRWKIESEDEYKKEKIRKIFRKNPSIVYGNICFFRKEYDAYTVYSHEKVKHYMIMGPFILLYHGLNIFVIRLLLKNASYKYDNPLEIDARRAAKLLVDVPGVIQRLHEELEKNN